MSSAAIAPPASRGPAGRRRVLRWINVAIGIVGAAVLLLGLVWVGRGPISCRGVEMHPGDVCTKSTFTQVNSQTTQTYEQRKASASASRPTVIGLGVALVGFSVLLQVVERRRARADDSADEG